MPNTLDQIRAEARAHAKQLEAVRFVQVRDLAERWGMDVTTVRAIPRAHLPYLEYGKSNRRRYDPRDVEEYERRAKAGDFHSVSAA